MNLIAEFISLVSMMGLCFVLTIKRKKTENQLHLSPDELNKLGFIESKNSSDTRLFFKKDSLNGYFYYNPLESKYVWYHKIIIDDNANDTLLDIRSLKDLQRLLRIFRL